MKRRTLKFMACATVMALTLSVAACGGSDDTEVTVDAEDVVDTEVTDDVEDVVDTAKADELENEVSETEDETDAVGGAEEADEPEDEVSETEDETDAVDEAEEEKAFEDYETLEEFFNDPTLKDVYDRMLEAMSDDELSLSYEVSGNDFVMIFTITDSDYVTDEVADGLVEALETQGDQFKAQAAQFDSILEGNGTCTVTVRYTDPDGNVMAEKTYTAD